MIHINLLKNRGERLRYKGRCEPIISWPMGVRTYTPMRHRILTRVHGAEIGIEYMYLVEHCLRCGHYVSKHR